MALEIGIGKPSDWSEARVRATGSCWNDFGTNYIAEDKQLINNFEFIYKSLAYTYSLKNSHWRNIYGALVLDEYLYFSFLCCCSSDWLIVSVSSIEAVRTVPREFLADELQRLEITTSTWKCDYVDCSPSTKIVFLLSELLFRILLIKRWGHIANDDYRLVYTVRKPFI